MFWTLELKHVLDVVHLDVLGITWMYFVLATLKLCMEEILLLQLSRLCQEKGSEGGT